MNTLEVFSETDKKAIEQISGHFISVLNQQKAHVENIAQKNEILEKNLFAYKKNGKLFAMLKEGDLIHSSLLRRLNFEELAKSKVFKASAFNRSEYGYSEYNFARFCLNSLICPSDYAFKELNGNQDMGDYFLSALEFYGSSFNTGAGISFIFDRKLSDTLMDAFRQDDKILKDDLKKVSYGNASTPASEKDHYENDSIIPYGIPTNFIAGIVLKKYPRESEELSEKRDVLVEKLKTLFPTSYIAFSTGEIAYLPKNIKVNECSYYEQTYQNF